ncbi:AraC family transcriptional regulator [Aliivibrio sifiae]|uniref:HTH araC/xylS-type domain-containing protein n=1 Tax=Aliivibrio sifiae TaxID=566293 RepID=A0A2S7X5Y4_9GAMM|nr:AraC family transcriptional regulator [Aliivibrio sifiae]PQJ86784.1 hypothetical protein BTO23_11635 [Aliivibrio sifiae]GLR74104.1 hypothetical protein GCM10007855_09780 [Aliivibrio sifiae]
MRHTISLVKSNHLHPFMAVFSTIGVSIERSLEYVGLNPDKVIEGEVFIPEYAAWHLLDYVSHSQGIDNLGSYISEQYAFDRYGAFGEHLLSAPSLYTALQRLIHDLRDHANYQNYWLQERGEYVELCRIGTPGIDVGKHQIEQHIMVLFIELVRSYLGETWSPEYLNIQSSSERGVKLSSTLRALNITYGQVYGVLPIHKSQLLKHTMFEKPVTPISLLQSSPSLAIDQQLWDLISQNTFHGHANLQSVTRAIGVNERHLQRELANLNTSFRDISNLAIRHKAMTLLNEITRPIQSIAQELGYSNPKNFSRAFKVLTGLSPSEYRIYNRDSL